MAAFRILSYLAAAAVVASCTALDGALGGADSSSFSAHELLVELPPLPAAWAGLPELRMSLSWEDAKGEVRTSVVEPGSKLRVSVARASPQAILATPYAAGRPLFPCGALYPEALARQESGSGTTGATGGSEAGIDSLRLDWLGGYAASLAALLKARGVDPWGFDLYRLVDEALERGSDPWVVPLREVARRLSTSTFKISIFKEPKRFAVALPSPSGSAWAPESPFASAATSQSLLPAGVWRFLSTENVLLVSVDSEGKATSLAY